MLQVLQTKTCSRETARFFHAKFWNFIWSSQFPHTRFQWSLNLILKKKKQLHHCLVWNIQRPQMISTVSLHFYCGTESIVSLWHSYYSQILMYLIFCYYWIWKSHAVATKLKAKILPTTLPGSVGRRVIIRTYDDCLECLYCYLLLFLYDWLRTIIPMKLLSEVYRTSFVQNQSSLQLDF